MTVCFLDLSTIRGFTKYFRSCRKLFVDPIILLRFATVVWILPTLQRGYAKNCDLNNVFFSDLKDILGLSLVGFRRLKTPCCVFTVSVSVKSIPVPQPCDLDSFGNKSCSLFSALRLSCESKIKYGSKPK